MSDMLDMLLNRRSVRTYTGEPIPEEKLKLVLEAGLLSESGHNVKPWEYIVIEDKEQLQKLTGCKVGSGKMLKDAGAAVIVVADETKTDLWIDDSAIAMANMHLMADSIGIGSCYINARYRDAVEGGSVEDFIRDYLKLPLQYRIVAILSLGIPSKKPSAHTLEELDWTKVHREKF